MATSKRAWQRNEQWWAELHGEKRTGPRGDGLPDTTNDTCPIAIECKFQEKRSLRAADVEQARRNAKGGPWILALHTKDESHWDDLVVMPLDTYIRLASKTLDWTMSLEPVEDE